MSSQLTFQAQHNSSRGDSTGTVNATDTDNTQMVLSDTSTPAVTMIGKGQVTLSGGAATLDLTAFTTLDGRTLNFTGLKIRSLKVTPLQTNTHDLTVAKGASNGYTGLGSSFSVTTHPPINSTLPSGCFEWYDGGNGVAVNSTVKTLDFTGNTTEAAYVSISGGA